MNDISQGINNTIRYMLAYFMFFDIFIFNNDCVTEVWGLIFLDENFKKYLFVSRKMFVN